MQDIVIKEYLHQVWKRRKIVAIFLCSVVALTALLTFRQPKIYRAVTVIEIGAETPGVGMFQDVANLSPYYGWWSALKYYETQFEIIKSRSLLSKAAKSAIDQGLVTGWKVDSLTGHLGGGLSIGSDEKSRLARIYFDDTDPQRAQVLSNLIAKTYVDENLAKKLYGISEAVEWLNQRMKEIRKEKSEQEEELQAYMEEHRIVSLEDQESTSRANLIALADTLNKLKSKRIEIQAQYDKLRELVKQSKRSEELFGVVSSDLLIKLKVDLAEMQAEKARLSQRYMEKHPRMVRVNAEMIEINKAIRQEVENEVSRLKTKYLLAKAEEESIAKALEKQKLENLGIDELTRKLADIRVVTDTNQKIFETLQRKIKEADLSALVRSNNIRIVDVALTPTKPISPDVAKNMLLALIIGLMGGIGLALLLDYIDDTFKTQEDVERYLQVPLLGLIPSYKTPGENGGGKGLEFIPFEEPSTTISEFYRTLRTNVLFISAAKGLKKILMVSTGPGEGKTVTGINLAVTLAQAGEKVVIIDLDLRRPKMHRAFEVENLGGVTNILLGETELRQAIKKSKIPHLDYIVAGAIPPNPAELLGTSGLKVLLEELAQNYDRVIIDSSPIAPVTDSIVLAQAVDGVVMIIRAGKTLRKPILFARQQLKKVGVDILGAVLNDVDVEKSTYSNYQYYKYGYKTYVEEQEEPRIPPPQVTA